MRRSTVDRSRDFRVPSFELGELRRMARECPPRFLGRVLERQGFRQVSRAGRVAAALEPGWERDHRGRLRRGADAKPDYFRRCLSSWKLALPEETMDELRKLGAVAR